MLCAIPYNYRPKRSFGQGNIFTSVCLSTVGGGYPSMPCRSVLGEGVGGYPSMPCKSGPVGGGLVPGGLQFFRGVLQFFGGVKGGPPNFFGGGFFFDFCFLWGYTPPPDQTPEYGQCSAGTHPTGMHSCYSYIVLLSPVLDNRLTTTTSRYKITVLLKILAIYIPNASYQT